MTQRTTLYLCLISICFFCATNLVLAQEIPTVSDQEPFARQAEVPSNVKIIEINHNHGGLNVVGWDKSFILIEGNRRATASSVEYARQVVLNIQIKAYERVPNRMVLEYDGPPSDWRISRESAGIDYTAHIPKHLAVDIKLHSGTLSVSEINNRVSIDHRSGNVTAQDISGKVQIRSQGGKVNVANIGDALKLDTQDCILNVQNVQGDTAIRNKNGDITVNNVAGKLIMNCLKGNIGLSQIQGRLDIDHRDGEIVANRFFDGLRIYLYRGKVRLAPQVPIPQNYYCAVDNGDIILRVPELSSMLAEVEVANGRIHSDFYMPIRADKNVSYAKGAINQGRYLVNLSVKNGSVSLLQSLTGVDEQFTTPATSTSTSTEKNESAPVRATGTVNDVEIRSIPLN